MRKYLQRLVEARETRAPGAFGAVRPALPSRSPVAETDQRLQVTALADALGAFAGETRLPVAAPVDESRTTPSHRTAHAVPSLIRPASPSPQSRPVVQRYAVTAPASAPAPSRAAPANPQPEQTQSLPATQQRLPARPRAMPSLALVQETHPLPPPVASQLSPAPPAVDVPRRRASASVEIPAREPAPIPMEAPQPHTHAETMQPAKPRSLPPEPAPAGEIRAAAPRSVREIELTEAEPVRAPPPPRQTVVIRETIRTPAEAPQKPQPAPQMVPRTAAEASVIGPLPRPEQARARLELCLR